MNNQLRQRIEVAIVRLLLQEASAQGFQPSVVWDGETDTKVNTHDEIMHLVFNLDDCTIRFRKRNGDLTGNWVKLALGNADECITDYGNDSESGGDFQRVIQKVERLLTHGVITFATCLADIPAWTTETSRGVCIHCGADRHVTNP